MRRSASPLVVAALLIGCGDRVQSTDGPRRYEIGRAPTAAELSAADVDVAPDGAGLPAGSGTVAEGRAVYVAKCASCHGANGEGIPPVNPALVGRDPRAEKFPFASVPGLPRTIGNYWPYATTVFDYIRRAMPPTAPGALTNDQVYAVTAYLLSANQILAADARLDSATLRAVKMPYADRFVRDDRKGGKGVLR